MQLFRLSFCCFWILMFLNAVTSSDDDDDDKDIDNDGVYDYTYMYTEKVCNENKVITPGHGNWKKYGFIMADSDGCYDPYINCELQLNVSLDHRITLRFQELSTYCYEDMLSIVEDGSTSDPTEVCGFYVPTYSLYSSSNWLKMKFTSGGSVTPSNCLTGFKLYYTAYHTGDCSDDEFRCSIDGRCIPDELICDMYDNCGDWSDERLGTCGLSTGGLIAVSAICALVGISFIVFIGYCIYDRTSKRKTRHRQEGTRNYPSEPPDDTLGSLSNAEPPPLYTYVNSVTAGVYEEVDDDGNSPPPYHSIDATP